MPDMRQWLEERPRLTHPGAVDQQGGLDQKEPTPTKAQDSHQKLKAKAEHCTWLRQLV